MNKVKFLNWITEARNKALISMPESTKNRVETKAYMQGVISLMDEIKVQVESGKFDTK